MLNDFGIEVDAKAPLGRVHLDSLKNPDEVIAYSRRRPWAIYGAVTGAKMVALDVDMNPEKGKDGWNSIWKLGLSVSSSYELPTINHGHHVLYRSRPDLHLEKSIPLYLADGTEVADVDRLAGDQYMILWSNIVPESLEELPVIPAEFCFNRPTSITRHPFEGSTSRWLGSLQPGPPDEQVLKAISMIPRSDFGRQEMLRRQAHLVRLGAEGHRGVREALEILKGEWLRPPWNTGKHESDWYSGLEGAIKKFGG